MTPQHGVSPTKRRREGKNPSHIGTIPPSLHQLSTRRLVWLPTIGRICIQQWLSGDHKEHTLLCELRNQPRIQNDRSYYARKTDQTGRNDSITGVIEKRDGGCTITTKRILRSTQKTRSEPTITRYGVVVATEHQDHKTIEETGLQENQTIENLGKDWNKRI